MSSHLTHGKSGAIRRFAGWVARGSVGHPMLEGINYRDALQESPSQMEIGFAIFANVLELDEHGEPVREACRAPGSRVALPVLHRRTPSRGTST
jgi:hypothetical protein